MRKKRVKEIRKLVKSLTVNSPENFKVIYKTLKKNYRGLN